MMPKKIKLKELGYRVFAIKYDNFEADMQSFEGVLG